MDKSFIVEKVSKLQYDLSAHAHIERQEESITIEEIEKVLFKGAIIEQYSNDPRGESCLVVDTLLHIICGMRRNRLLIVTVYRPKPPVWIDYKTRAKEVKSRG